MSLSAAPTDVPQIDFELPDDQSLSEQLAGCLQFSSAFTSVGFETINDSVLREMNERATHQLTQTEGVAAVPSNDQILPPPPTDSPKGRQSPFDLRNFQKMTTSPPHTHFSAAHNQQFANSQSLQLSPQAKRLGEGEESPSKRRRAPDGKSVDILHSPTQSLQQISLNASNQIAQASASRQRERQRKELQASPRRRGQLMGRRVSSDNTSASSANFGVAKSTERSKLHADTTPDLKPPPSWSGSMPGSFPNMFSGSPNTSTGSAPTSSAPTSSAPTSSAPTSSAPTGRLVASLSMRFEPSSRSVSNPPVRSSPSQTDLKNFTTSPLGRKPLINTITKQSIRPMSYHVHSNRTPGLASGSALGTTSSSTHAGAQSSSNLSITHTSGQSNSSSSSASGRMPRTTSSRHIPERPRIPSSQSMRHIPNPANPRTLPNSNSSRQLSTSLDPKPAVQRSIPTSQSMRQLPRSSSSRTLPPISQRSVSSSSANPSALNTSASSTNNALPSYARPTVASLRYAQATQASKSSDQINPGRVRR